MPAQYICGSCDDDVTAEVTRLCTAAPTPVAFERGPPPVKRIRAYCRNEHLCVYPCSPNASVPVKGTPVAAPDAERWKTWLAYADPAASMGRLNTHARWLLTGNTLVAALGGALATIGVTTVDRPEALYAYAGSIFFFGASMVVASLAIAPRLKGVDVNDPEDVARAYQTLLPRQSRRVTSAGALFTAALVLAGLVPFLQLRPQAKPQVPKDIRLSFAVKGDGALAAALTARNADSPIELALMSRNRTGKDTTLLTQAIARQFADTVGTAEAKIEASAVSASATPPKSFWLVGRWGWSTTSLSFTDSLRIALPSGAVK